MYDLDDGRPDMTCREFIGFLMDYLSGAVSEQERATFDAHLSVCPACRAYLKTYEETVKMGKAAYAAPEEKVPAEVPEELVQAILASRKQ
jgi:anti-sigma factor RsiW